MAANPARILQRGRSEESRDNVCISRRVAQHINPGADCDPQSGTVGAIGYGSAPPTASFWVILCRAVVLRVRLHHH